ncbi:MAG TPA: LuxR C-terminal-related transcriptional regulator [Steroidobacter sp.]|nr:LuxR C-terminal-related transcriptional regulator [Steroidobacter sp.]
MIERTTSPAHLAARVIPAIGRPEFPAVLLSVYRDLAGCELCSAFSWQSERGPKLLFAAGEHPRVSGFALSASQAYTQRYWQSDAALVGRAPPQQCSSSRTAFRSGLSVVRMTAADIRDADYRRDCYQNGGIRERLTLFDPRFPAISVNGYRSDSRGPTAAPVAQWLADAGPTLMAALRRHNELLELAEQPALSPSLDAVMQWARKRGLSAREAQVVAGLTLGQTQLQIAGGVGLSVNSVITYRRRAYQKLKVVDRRALQALYGRSMANG